MKTFKVFEAMTPAEMRDHLVNEHDFGILPQDPDDPEEWSEDHDLDHDVTADHDEDEDAPWFPPDHIHDVVGG